MIYIKNKNEIEKIRKSGRLAAQALDMVEKNLKPGITTKEIDTLVHNFIIKHKAIPATLGYNGFPASCCTSINEVVVHGIPGSRIVEDGDIVKVDITAILDGYFGDTTKTFLVGNVSETAKKLTAATKKALDLAIKEVKPGARLGNIGAAIQEHVEPLGYSVVRDFVGHGTGIKFHEAPHVFHYGKRNSGIRLREGMVFTIEPMINEGDFNIKVLDDDWTAITVDGKLSAQFEHTIAVTENGYDILTLS